jgi:hypothetical protein
MLIKIQEKKMISGSKMSRSWIGEVVYFFLRKQGRKKKNRPTQLENRLGFRGELIEFNHSLAGFLFSRFLLVGLFSFLVQKKENS